MTSVEITFDKVMGVHAETMRRKKEVDDGLISALRQTVERSGKPDNWWADKMGISLETWVSVVRGDTPPDYRFWQQVENYVVRSVAQQNYYDYFSRLVNEGRGFGG